MVLSTKRPQSDPKYSKYFKILTFLSSVFRNISEHFGGIQKIKHSTTTKSVPGVTSQGVGTGSSWNWPQKHPKNRTDKSSFFDNLVPVSVPFTKFSIE